MTDADYTVTFEGVEFGPIPASWLDHPNTYDRDRRGGPRLLAVSAAAYRPKTLRVRYAHPRTGQVLVCQTAGHERDGETVPRALVNGSGWPRSLRPGRSDPMDVLRVAEEQHLEALWADRVELPVGQQRERAVADGGNTVDQFRPLRICQACKRPETGCFCPASRTCPTCRGRGFNCIDDICHGKGYCIHGDTCVRCEGSGAVLPERVLLVPDETAASIREYARDNPSLVHNDYAEHATDEDPLQAMCYPVAEAYYHLTGREHEVYCLSWNDVDDGLDGTHWYLRHADSGQWTDISLRGMPPVELPPFEQGTHRGWITGDDPSQRAQRIIDAVDGGGRGE